MSHSPPSIPALTWLLAGLEVLLSMALAAWVLTVPAVFGIYYPLLRVSPHSADAKAVVEWLSTDYRTRSLQLAVKGGPFTEKELRHYLDVRQVFRWFPRVALATSILATLLIFATRPSRETLGAGQWKALAIWTALLLVFSGMALWDWKQFFAWMHQPFFGDRSWRMPRNSYSLVLFPAWFWGFTTACVMFAPGLALLAGSLALRLGR